MKNEYGKLNDGATELVCTVKDFSKYMNLVFADECPEGFLTIVKDPDKPTPTGDQILWFRYVVEDGVLKKHYFCRKPPRVLSKLYIYTTLQPLGLYEPLMRMLESTTLPNGINCLKAYNEANEISEENALFLTAFSQIQEALNLTDEQADQILDQCKQK